MKKLKNYITDIEDEIIDIRRDFHKHPELGFEETRTAKIIAQKLNSWGYEVKENVAKTGVVGILKGEKQGPTIALRSDIDALPITEKNNLNYSSVNEGKMHACGHDGHMAILLGTAKVLAKYKNEISGNIKLIFQPAEEGPGGAKPMIDEGVIEDVDLILGLHIWPDLDSGKVGVKKGPLFASIDEIDIEVVGESSHGASPHQGTDAVLVAAELVSSLQSVVSRKIDPVEPSVITIGKINGGYVRNVIADNVSLEGTVRCVSPEIRKKLELKIKEIIKGVTMSHGASYNLEYRNMYSPLINNDYYTDIVKNIAQTIVGKENVDFIEKPTMGGEDFAYFLKEVPGTFFLLGGRNEDKGITASNHNPNFNFDEDILKTGVEILVKSSFEIMEKGAN